MHVCTCVVCGVVLCMCVCVCVCMRARVRACVRGLKCGHVRRRLPGPSHAPASPPAPGLPAAPLPPTHTAPRRGRAPAAMRRPWTPGCARCGRRCGPRSRCRRASRRCGAPGCARGGAAPGLAAWMRRAWPHSLCSALESRFACLHPSLNRMRSLARAAARAAQPVLDAAARLQLGPPKYRVTLLGPEPPHANGTAAEGADEDARQRAAVEAAAAFRAVMAEASGLPAAAAPLSGGGGGGGDGAAQRQQQEQQQHGPWRPFFAPLLVNRRLTSPDHFQDTRHLEFGLDGSGLAYEPGDLLAVFPRTPEADVQARASMRGDDLVTDAVSLAFAGRPTCRRAPLLRPPVIPKTPRPQAALRRLGLEGGELLRIEAARRPGGGGGDSSGGGGAAMVASARAVVQGVLDVSGASPRRYLFQARPPGGGGRWRASRVAAAPWQTTTAAAAPDRAPASGRAARGRNTAAHSPTLTPPRARPPGPRRFSSTTQRRSARGSGWRTLRPRRAATTCTSEQPAGSRRAAGGQLAGSWQGRVEARRAASRPPSSGSALLRPFPPRRRSRPDAAPPCRPSPRRARPPAATTSASAARCSRCWRISPARRRCRWSGCSRRRRCCSRGSSP
jgi:hypothetical protein